MSHLLIFDARHLLYRAADVFSDLGVEADGEFIPTGAMYGFLNVAMTVHKRWDGIAVVAWEGTKNFRYGLYPEYKQKKEVTEADTQIRERMEIQEVHLKEMLSMLGIYQYSGIGCEADDVIGTISKRMSKKGYNAIIYSGDGDLRQLVDSQIMCVSPGFKGKDKAYTFGEVVRKDGVEPSQIPDMKALAGDTSDNIPGVRGVGPKTASKLISLYGDIEGVLRAAQESDDWPVPVRHKTAILGKANDIRLFKQLTTIKTDVQLVRIEPNRRPKEFVKKLYDYKFSSLITHLKLSALRRMAGP